MYIFEKSLSRTEDILYPLMDVGATELILTLFLLKAIINLFLYVVKFRLCDSRPNNGNQICNKALKAFENYFSILLYVGASLIYFYFTYRAVKRTGKVSAFGPKTLVSLAAIAGVFVVFNLILTILNFNDSNHNYGENFGEFIQKEISADVQYFVPQAGNYTTNIILGVLTGFVAGII